MIENYNTQEDLQKVLNVLDPSLYDKGAASQKEMSLNDLQEFFKMDADALNQIPDKEEKLILYPLLYDAQASLIPYTSNQSAIENSSGVKSFDRKKGH